MKHFFLLLIGITFIYGILIYSIHHSLFGISNYRYYNFLIDALLHKRYDLHTSQHYDLSFIHKKWFLYWGPFPIIFILPFYIFGRLNTSDIFYTGIAGIGNCVLITLLIQECMDYFSLRLSIVTQMFLILFFALCSPNLYLSLGGTIWATNQVIAIFYLLSAYFFLFRFMNRKKNYWYLLSLIFFNFAWLTRYSIIFNFPLFLFPIIQHYKLSSKKFLILVIILIATMLGGLLSLSITNYVKTGSIFHTGYIYVQGSPRYNQTIKPINTLSIHYFGHNALYYFINVLHFSKNFPFVIINKEGNSIFSVYPYVLFLLYFFRTTRKSFKQNVLFFTLAWSTILVTLIFFLFYFATGWGEFGTRYLFDAFPVFFILFCFVIQYVSLELLTACLLYSVFANMFGTIAFYLVR